MSTTEWVIVLSTIAISIANICLAVWQWRFQKYVKKDPEAMARRPVQPDWCEAHGHQWDMRSAELTSGSVHTIYKCRICDRRETRING